jgi:hypothetical protein
MPAAGKLKTAKSSRQCLCASGVDDHSGRPFGVCSPHENLSPWTARSRAESFLPDIIAQPVRLMSDNISVSVTADPRSTCDRDVEFVVRWNEMKVFDIGHTPE